MAHYLAGELTLSGWREEMGGVSPNGAEQQKFPAQARYTQAHILYSRWIRYRGYTEMVHLRGSQKKRCRLSWLTNSALVYEPKYGGGWVAGFQLMSTAVHMEPKETLEI